MIYGLVEENPEYAQLVRLKLSEMQILPDVITKITVLYCEDEVWHEKKRKKKKKELYKVAAYLHTHKDRAFEWYFLPNAILVLSTNG